jgi:4-amino-4-deoxy-L-arabinose transferase-like glycosyltransferase
VELSAQVIEREAAGPPSPLIARPRRALVALLALALVIYAIPLGERSLWNQDEARQALLARNTLRHGLRLPVKVRDEAYLNKPPLYFWSVALVSWPRGRVSEHTAAIPSVAAALAALTGAFAIARLLSGPVAGFVALVVVGTSPGFYLHSHALLPDMALTAWLTWVLYFLLAALRDETPSRAHLIGLYGCIAGAMWIKGLPALLVLPAGGAAVLAARGRSGFAPLRPLLGLGLVAVVMLPWAIPYLLTPGHDSGQSTDAGTALAWYLDRFDRVSSIPLTGGLISFLPWTLWAVVLGVWWRRAPERVAYRPVVVWAAVTMFLIALAVQQRSRYLLPLYPVFAVLVAAAVTGATARTRGLVRLNFGVVLTIVALTLGQAARLAMGRRPGHTATPADLDARRVARRPAAHHAGAVRPCPGAARPVDPWLAGRGDRVDRGRHGLCALRRGLALPRPDERADAHRGLRRLPAAAAREGRADPGLPRRQSRVRLLPRSPGA